ncbi:SusC/RagA family TonB-linked outer membrane protein [Pedobacter cryoconitis]|uniref:TonB-linked SusC/RagA family outer membrane protein n=1 Tax=Pedobacter cryoconitis TaxID=188932 RepID=A0A7X0J6E6_9SPHI|nr:SusC/RagA family TonB-linked outer membrane protein [Pedobacter cryoconitis]MBB6500697.1 TonB-linked SusC/RagA family outer membrane protein [Pedobacter cryoconitis]
MVKNLLLFLVLIGLGLSGYSQKKTAISGQVLDPEGLPIPGASVYVDKSTIGVQTGLNGVIQNIAIGTVTDSEGKFTLSVPEGTPTIRVSYMGYNSMLVNIINKTKLTISMESNENNLGEVVVNGYTAIAKRKNTTATTVLEYSKMRQSGVSGIDQMLEGQIAGVAVTTLTGGPSAAPKIRIRGTVSLNGGQDPLWVLDGIPLEGTNMPNNLTDKDNIDQLRNLPIAGLNPDDIADITILKDAAATSIYGARAANGVIVITTKKGKKGPVSINFNANTFIAERPDFSKLNLMNSTEKVDFELGLAARPDLTFRNNQGEIIRILNKNNELDNYQANGFSALSPATQQQINSLRQNNTNWGKELYQTAINQQYSLSLSGGNDQANYYFSGGYYDEKGTSIGTGMKRYNLTLKTDFNISQKLKFGAAIFASKTDRKNYLADIDGFTNPAKYSRNVNPYQVIRNADGSYAYDQDIFGTSNAIRDIYVPFNVIEERENTRYTLGNKSLKSILDMDYQITKDLKLHSELGLQFDETGSEKYAGIDSYYARRIKETTSYYDSKNKKYAYFLPVGGIIENQKTSFFQYNWKSLLEYKKVINEKHEIEALAGTEFRKNNNEDLMTKGFGFNERTLTNQNIIFPNSTQSDNPSFRTYRKDKLANAYASFYGTLSYTYDRKYTVYGSVRYDGSDLFGVDPKYKYLPIYSVSGAWNANEEDFVKNLKWISNLRIRSSYGIQGNIDKNTSPMIVGRYKTAEILPGNVENTISVESPPNDKLRWEKTTTYNAGLDLGLFNNAFQVTFDYYNRNSNDLIGLQSLPLENGFEFTNKNFAQVKNKGLELTISTRNISTKKFQWFTDFNIAHNKSKVIREEQSANLFTPSRQGYPVNALFVMKTAGLDADGIPQFMQNGKVVSMENFYKIYDPFAEVQAGLATGTALSNKEYQSLYTYAGDRDPKYTGGLINRFRYGNLDLSISAVFNLSQMMLINPSYKPALVDRGMNYSRDILNAWTPTHTNTNQPRIIDKNTGDGSRWMAADFMNTNDPGNSYKYLDVFAKKVSYMRLNSIRLGYTLPAKISSKIKANALRFSVEGRNLFVLSTGYKGYFDPETYGNIYAQPISRSISIGVNATF